MGSVLALRFSMLVNFSQLAFQKFHHLTGSVGMGVNIQMSQLVMDDAGTSGMGGGFS